MHIDTIRIRYGIAILALLMVACVAPQKPYRFALPAQTPNLLPRIRGVLAEQGQEVDYLDEQAGIVRTRWVDTGFLMGKVQGQTATVVRRYTVIAATNSDGSIGLMVRADTKKCAQDGFEVAGEMVTGACENMTELAPQHQKELDALGVTLQQRLQQMAQ